MTGEATGLGLMGDPQMGEGLKSLGIISNESGDHLEQVWVSPVIRHQPIYHHPTTNPETFPAFERNSRRACEALWITDEFSAGVKR